jgi:hypothetical protein
VAPKDVAPAVYTDPVVGDARFGARNQVVKIPTQGVNINGLMLVAAGQGLHPTMVLLHDVPGNEKNLDLAQSVRSAGWNVLTLNYRGSWGSLFFSLARTLSGELIGRGIRVNAISPGAISESPFTVGSELVIDGGLTW